MKSSRFWWHRFFLWVGVLFFVVCLVAWSTGARPVALPVLAGSAVCLALAAGTGQGMMREMAFTIWIVTGVVMGMVFHGSLIRFPSWFFGLGGTKLTVLIIPLLQIIMFAMGTTLSLADFARVLKMPGGVMIGLACQFTIMPLLGFTLAHVMGLPPAIAAGLILVGVSPCGLASNVMSFIARANVAMSVTITALATLVSPLITPVLMKSLAGEMVEINVTAMMEVVGTTDADCFDGRDSGDDSGDGGPWSRQSDGSRTGLGSRLFYSLHCRICSWLRRLQAVAAGHHHLSHHRHRGWYAKFRLGRGAGS